ncbi:hypothetical protein Ct61P_15517 [Colletotrichum tofieldiae]|nr:hypothetical protein Ct61P_15517 [Colletotrichum tofieldiae]
MRPHHEVSEEIALTLQRRLYNSCLKYASKDRFDQGDRNRTYQKAIRKFQTEIWTETPSGIELDWVTTYDAIELFVRIYIANICQQNVELDQNFG